MCIVDFAAKKRGMNALHHSTGVSRTCGFVRLRGDEDGFVTQPSVCCKRNRHTSPTGLDVSGRLQIHARSPRQSREQAVQVLVYVCQPS